MKTKDDKFTADMFGNRLGRPHKPNAMTVAERVRMQCNGICTIGQRG